MDEKEKIARKIKYMEKYVDFLQSYKSVTTKKLKEDYLLKSAIERNFHLAIEASLDIGEIIISTKGFEKPEDYRSVILLLGKHAIIPIDFAERFASAASFRNILVHMYDELDMEKLCDYLQTNLGDFEEFAKYIAKYLEKEK